MAQPQLRGSISKSFLLLFLLQGTNLRQTVIDVMDKLQDYMLKNHADDHKSLSMLISAYEHSLQSFGISRIELEHHRNRSAIFRFFSTFKVLIGLISKGIFTCAKGK